MTPPLEDRSAHGTSGPAALRRTILGAILLSGVLALLVFGASSGWVVQGPTEAPPGSREVRTEALLVVASVCAVSSLGGWIVTRLGAADPALAVSRSLGGMALRLVLPLALLAWLSVGPMASPEAARFRDVGAGGLLVVFYLSLLATDILLHIMWGPRAPGKRRPSGSPPP